MRQRAKAERNIGLVAMVSARALKVPFTLGSLAQLGTRPQR